MLAAIFRSRNTGGPLDLEAVETLVRSTMHNAGAAVLGRVLDIAGPQQRELPCPCGSVARYRERRSRNFLSVVGPTVILRPWYLCPACHQGMFPADKDLDILNTDFSPGVRRMQALVGQQGPFAQGREQMKLLAGLNVTAKSVERVAESIGADIARKDQARIGRAVQLNLPIMIGPKIPVLYIQMDGTGVPVVKKETQGRKGKTDGQPAHTREVKLGCVFVQTGWDAEGRAIRDPDTTTYTAAIETAEQFGKRLYVEAWNRGWDRAKKKVVLADGAEWCWNQTAIHFPGAVEIVDLFHARQHLWDTARRLHTNDPVLRDRWIRQHEKGWLDKGKIEKIVASLRAVKTENLELAKLLGNEADYFERNRERIRYPKFRKQHLFVGSGVIEAGCKTVIGSRLKQSGMFSSVDGANAIIALRCAHLNGTFEDYWASRNAA